MKKNKTLLILIPGFPASEQDDTCVPFPQSFVYNLKLLYPDLHIIVLAFQYPFRFSVYRWNGIQVYSFNGRNRGGWRRLLVWKKVWRQIKILVRENQVIGALNFWLGDCAWIARIAANRFGFRAFTWILGQDARKGNRYVFRVRPEPENLIALSDFISEEFNRNYGFRPRHIIPPGIDTKLFTAMQAENLEKKIDILGAGSLIPLKQYNQFIRLIGSLKDIKPDLKAILCGAGPERKFLEQLICKSGLQNNIELTGELDHGKVLSLMQDSKIFLHPSSYEGYGMACAEALYAGAHVVSYCQPMKEISPHQYIVQTENDMKQTIIRLLGDNDLSHGPVLNFSIENTCRQVYRLIIESSPGISFPQYS